MTKKNPPPKREEAHRGGGRSSDTPSRELLAKAGRIATALERLAAAAENLAFTAARLTNLEKTSGNALWEHLEAKYSVPVSDDEAMLQLGIKDRGTLAKYAREIGYGLGELNSGAVEAVRQALGKAAAEKVRRGRENLTRAKKKSATTKKPI